MREQGQRQEEGRGQHEEERTCGDNEQRGDILAAAGEEQDERVAEDDTKRQIELRGDCVTLRQLAVSGEDFPQLHGREIGQMLHLLLSYVLEHPEQNTKSRLLAAAPQLWQAEHENNG